MSVCAYVCMYALSLGNNGFAMIIISPGVSLSLLGQSTEDCLGQGWSGDKVEILSNGWMTGTGARNPSLAGA